MCKIVEQASHLSNQPKGYQVELKIEKTCVRVETGTEFATRVPDTHYPTRTRVLVTMNLG